MPPANRAQQLLEAALESLATIEAAAPSARESVARSIVTPLARELGASPADIQIAVDGLIATVENNEPPPEEPVSGTADVEVVREEPAASSGSPATQTTQTFAVDSPALRGFWDVIWQALQTTSEAVNPARAVDYFTNLPRALGPVIEHVIDAGARATAAGRPEVVEAAAAAGATGAAEEEEEEPARPRGQNESLLRFLSKENADLQRTRDQVVREAAARERGRAGGAVLGGARQAYRAANLPMYAQGPRQATGPDGQPLFDDNGQPVMETVGEQGNAPAAPFGPDGQPLPPGYHVERPITREEVGRYGSADALERRAAPRSARFDDAGQILATDGRPLLEVGRDGELRVRRNPDGSPMQPMTSSTTTRGPMYSDGDELYWAGHSPEQIGPIQARLARAGLIGPEDSVTWGWWDQTTQEAYTMALGYANQRGTTWIDALDEMQQLQEAGIGDRMRQLRSQYEPDIEAYRAPDPAAVRNDVRTTIEDYLRGHEAPTEALQALINDLQGWHREQYDAETQAVMAAFDAQLEGLVDPNMWIPQQYGGTPPPEPEMGGIPPEGPPEVDLGARLSEAVRTRLAPQRALLGQQETNVGTQQSVHASVQGLLARLRGGL